MPDFLIDPELWIRASPPIVLRRTTEAVDFIRKVALSSPDRAWHDILQSLEAARDEWSAMEVVVHLELLLEARGLLIEEGTGHAFFLALFGISLALLRVSASFAQGYGPRGGLKAGRAIPSCCERMAAGWAPQ